MTSDKIKTKRVLTVGALAKALSKLPSETRIRELTCTSEELISGLDELGIFVYYGDAETELHIDDGMAHHSQYLNREHLLEYLLEQEDKLYAKSTSGLLG